jgi:hypothetical protein
LNDKIARQKHLNRSLRKEEKQQIKLQKSAKQMKENMRATLSNMQKMYVNQKLEKAFEQKK